MAADYSDYFNFANALGEFYRGQQGKRIPGAPALEEQSSKDIADLLNPPSLFPDTSRQAAEVSAGRGVPGTAAAWGTGLRMTDEERLRRMALGQNMLTAAYGRNPVAPLPNYSDFYVNPNTWFSFANRPTTPRAPASYNQGTPGLSAVPFSGSGGGGGNPSVPFIDLGGYNGAPLTDFRGTRPDPTVYSPTGSVPGGGGGTYGYGPAPTFEGPGFGYGGAGDTVPGFAGGSMAPGFEGGSGFPADQYGIPMDVGWGVDVNGIPYQSYAGQNQGFGTDIAGQPYPTEGPMAPTGARDFYDFDASAADFLNPLGLFDTGGGGEFGFE